jgi:hypothetical protein
LMERFAGRRCEEWVAHRGERLGSGVSALGLPGSVPNNPAIRSPRGSSRQGLRAGRIHPHKRTA